MATSTSLNLKISVIPCKNENHMLQFNCNRTLKTEQITNSLLSDNIQIEGDKDMNKTKEYSKRGNPYKRGDTWTFIYYMLDTATGKKKQKYKSGFKTKKDAEQALNEINAKIITGQYVEDKNITLEQYLKQWYKDICLPRLTQNTLNGYKVNIYNHIIPFLGQKKILDINRLDVRQFYNSLINRLSPQTIQYIHRTLSKAFNEAVNEGLLLKNPCNKIERPSVKKYKAGVYNFAQVKILIEATKNTQYELPILFGVILGLRRGEALGLRFSDINFKDNTAHIQQQITRVASPDNIDKSIWGVKELKTEGSNRVISVPPFVIDIVKHQQIKVMDNKLFHGKEYKDYDFICCTKDGNFINPDTLDRNFKRIIKKAQLPDIRFHDLRHSFATNLLEMDVPLKVISNSLGHSAISITADIYCDVLEKKKQVAEVMQNAMFSTV